MEEINEENNRIYKGYITEVKYSKEDNCYYVVFENQQGDSISVEGETIKALEKDFQNAIEDYLQLCKELKKEPK